MNLEYVLSRHEFPVALLVEHPIDNGEGLVFESHFFFVLLTLATDEPEHLSLISADYGQPSYSSDRTEACCPV